MGMPFSAMWVPGSEGVNVLPVSSTLFNINRLKLARAKAITSQVSASIGFACW